MKTTHYHVNSISAAWAKVNEVFPTDYSKDENSSARAGYPVFRSSIGVSGLPLESRINRMKKHLQKWLKA